MRRTVFTLLVLSALAPGLLAATVVRVGVDDMTDQATVVVRGEVLSVEARWTEDKTTINTYVRIRVAKTLKGKVGTEVTATCFGGTVGKDKVKVSGVPEFTKGEKVVVFLWKNVHGDYLVLGWNQGKFRIEKDAKTGVERAKNSLDGLALVGAPDGKGGRRKVKRTADEFGPAELEKKILDRIEARKKEIAAEKEAARKRAEEALRNKRSEEKEKPSEGKTDPKKEEKPAGTPDAGPDKKTEPDKKKRSGEEPPSSKESTPDRR